MLEYSYITNRIVTDELFNERESVSIDFLDHDPFYCDAAYYQQIEKSLGINYIKNMNLSEELEKELVRQSLIRLVIHEVGHTLGLSHNFKGSLLLTCLLYTSPSPRD